MRSELRALLVAGVPAVGGRVYEPYFPNAATAKPYLVVKKGVVNPEDEWATHSEVWEVWAYVAQNARFDALDGLLAQVEAVLGDRHTTMVFTDALGNTFKSEWLGCMDEDGIDPELQAKFRYASYRMFDLGWLVDADPEPNPARALRNWSAQMWPDLQLDPLTWQPSSPHPGLYWRTQSYHLADRTNWGGWINAQVFGHIVTPAVLTRREWTKRVCEAIIRQRHLILPDRTPLYFGTLDGNSEADPMRVGQVSLSTRYGILIERPVGPILQRATIGGTTAPDREIVHLVEAERATLTDAETLAVFGHDAGALVESQATT